MDLGDPAQLCHRKPDDGRWTALRFAKHAGRLQERRVRDGESHGLLDDVMRSTISMTGTTAARRSRA